MSSFASAATASAATPAEPPPLPLIADYPNYTGHSYDLTLYKFSNVLDAHYSDDDKVFFNNFGDAFKENLRYTINSRDSLTLTKKELCNDWINGVSIQKIDTQTSTVLRRQIQNEICGEEMDSAFLTNRYADLKKKGEVAVLVMLVTINITTSAGVPHRW
jgi:hypothetical protein